MLALSDIDAGYGPSQVLFGVSFTAHPGQIHVLMGRNGAGKTTCLRTIMGQVRATAGSIMLGPNRLDTLPAHQVPQHGLGLVPQGRRLFTDLTVAENLEVGLMTRNTPRSVLTEVLAMFPRLRERLSQRAETLSGGEQQMLATARALCLQPSVLLLDEPTEGLQPSMIALIRDAMVRLRDAGTAVVLVEQRVDAVLAIADQVTFLENGRIAESLSADGLTHDHPAFHRYVGV